ncbi:DELTA-sagatoxin-Srs1a-like [Parambassis ranga]|uniref:DELTA-sagatoxin-Srs1a-like n=1 Tax=Parambassis ranga TaxID=210632 RepID=A0A6P7IRI8_9TELE|nr:DELTA-sagatoxin-Srs1a-like [Parambassis ranga]XP_028268219.1 DELTA-sagatoxin-Srs1a-like [Parambassis ranga]
MASLPPRRCSIEIQNKSSMFTLSNPCVHCVSGYNEAPLPPTLSPSETGSALFLSTPTTARGSVGVFTYDLQNPLNMQFYGKIAVMFSVPYDFNLYSNWYAVGMFDMDKHCDKHLYKEMYYNTELGFVRGKAKGPSLAHTGPNVTIRATMSDSYQPVLKVQVCNN